MDDFFKRCGIGIAVIVFSPLWIAFFALVILYASLNLILSPLKMVFYLVLKKQNYSIRSSYDEQAERILKQLQSPQPPVNNNIPGYMFTNAPTTSFTSIKSGTTYQAPNQPSFNNNFQNNIPNINPYNNPNNFYSNQNYQNYQNPPYPNQTPNFPNSFPPQNNFQNQNNQVNGFNYPNNNPNNNENNGGQN